MDNNISKIDFSTTKIKLAINKYIVNKDEDALRRFNHCFENVEFTLEQLIEHISNGYVFTSELTRGNRHQKNFKSAQIIVIDIDNFISLESFLNDPLVQSTYTFVYTTTNHRKDGNNDRFRAIQVLESPIDNLEEYRNLTRISLKHYFKADQNCKDGARAWYGSKNCKVFKLDGMLSNEAKSEILLADAKELESKKKKKLEKKELQNNRYESPTQKDIEEMLSFIDPMPGYDIWCNCIWAIGKYFPMDKAKAIIENWSPDYKNDGKEIVKLLEKNDGRISIGTLIYYASLNGYKRPLSLYRLQQTPGQVAYEEIFSNGQGYLSNGISLFKYGNGYYQEQEDNDLLSDISKHFHSYLTSGKIKNAFANSKDSIEALRWVKSICFVHPQNYNPPGLNVNNGYLRPFYENDSVKFILEKHSEEHFFTYKINANYDQNNDGSEVRGILQEMISNPEIEIILRLISSTFDLKKIREKYDNHLRALLLSGEGDNGKDMLREWIDNLFGQSMASVPLESFRTADKGGFTLAPLIGKQINWSSENKPILLDNCQTLKAAITGDKIQVNIKYCPIKEIAPQTIFIFNVNKLPHLKSLKGAMLKRFCIIDFLYTFKSKPNPQKPNEKKANTELKRNKELIEATILPGLLSLLVQAFKDLFNEGIDYTSVENNLIDLGMKSNHVIRFVKELDIVECPISQGLTSQELYDFYENWCIEEGLISKDQYSKKYSDEFDRVARASNSLTDKLKSVFPNLITDRSKGQRKIGLNKKDSISFHLR